MRIVRALTFASCLLFSANVFAQSGTLILQTLYGGNSQILTIDQIGSDYLGTLITNGIPENVSVIQLFNGWQMSVGDETYTVTAIRSPTTTHLEGTISQGRTVEFFATYKENRNVWLYDGTVGIFDDLTGKGQTDQLNLSWNKSKLLIKSTENGGCAGETRIGNIVTHSFVCTTSGTMTDAFFLSPDHVLLWLINLYAKQ